MTETDIEETPTSKEDHAMTTTILDRNHDSELLIENLSSSGMEQSRALTELRAFILRGLISSLSGRTSTDVLEDVTQEAVLKIIDRLHQFEGRSRFTTWAMSIAIRGAMSELRRRHWKHESLESALSDRDREPEAYSPAPTEPDPDQRAIIDAMHSVIRTELTDRQRDALLAELRGMPLAEIARHMGSNRNAIYKLTHDARKRLKRGLERAGYSAASVATAFN